MRHSSDDSEHYKHTHNTMTKSNVSATTNKKVLTTVDDVKKALRDAKLDNKFRVVATESSLNDNNVKIHVINSDKTLSSVACFTIGVNRINFRFSSNSKFSACAFLKDEKVNSKQRFEVTVKRDDIVTVLKQACADYSKRYDSKKKATATESKATESKAK